MTILTTNALEPVLSVHPIILFPLASFPSYHLLWTAQDVTEVTQNTHAHSCIAGFLILVHSVVVSVDCILK